MMAGKGSRMKAGETKEEGGRKKMF